MSTYKTVRGKSVQLGSIRLDVDAETGNLVILVAEADAPTQTMNLGEAVASSVYNLLGDVMEWESQRNTTENDLERQGEAAEAKSGELDDVKAASNK